MPSKDLFDLRNIRTPTDVDPRHYVLSDSRLKKAIEMAILLGKPLLITGVPGTGKTQLAFKVAYELHKKDADRLNGFAPFVPKPFIFNTKTTSAASDLFYSYDAISHFQKKAVDQVHEDGHSPNQVHSFIQLNAFGKAILQTYGKKEIAFNERLRELRFLKNFDDLDDGPGSSVVLIDEIDKAPRDFPNDLLNEIENYEFTIKELNNSLTIREAQQKGNSPLPKVVVIMTSNFEKDLPDAFLRRCLFYHIPMPDAETLVDIVCSRMEPYLEEIYGNKNKEYVSDRFLKVKNNVREGNQ